MQIGVKTRVGRCSADQVYVSLSKKVQTHLNFANPWDVNPPVHCLVQSYSDFLNSVHIGRGRVQLPWADSASSNLTRLSKYLCTPQNIFNSWEGFLFQWTSHILNQKFFHFHFHKCHSPFHRYSKDNNLSGSNSPMNSFLRRFLSFSWGVEMTRQLMKARSTVLHIWKFFREALF